MSWLRVSLVLAAAMGVAGSPALAQTAPLTAPETFTSPIVAKTAGGSQSATISIDVDHYMTEFDRTTMTDGLRYGGYSGFLQALRKSPVVGYVVIGSEKFGIRWAREERDANGRRMSFVTDTPIYFIGGGRSDPKARSGFQLGVVQISVDEKGTGTGSMAGAARVKPDGKGGVVLEDYAAEPIKLTSIQRVRK